VLYKRDERSKSNRGQLQQRALGRPIIAGATELLWPQPQSAQQQQHPMFHVPVHVQSLPIAPRLHTYTR
jgi:hypothetical protein